MKKLAIILLSTLVLSSCLKQAFDSPPDTSHVDAGVPAGTTLISIAQLKALNGLYTYSNGGDTTIVQTDVCIAAIVTADDRSGNLYKSINIEDSTGGIQLLIDAYSLYNQYPVGRKIYVKCRGLMLGYNAGIPQLGAGVNEQLQVGNINGSQIESHIIKADVGHTVTPISVTLAQVSSYSPNSAANRAMLARLVRIDDVEFKVTDKTYAQPNDNTNRTAKNCGKDTIAVRTSNYARFAAVPLPAGHGFITGVYTIYTSGNPSTGAVSRIYPQLVIRDTSDVQLYGARCDGVSGGGSSSGGTTARVISLDSLRTMYTGSGLKLGACTIHGTVISDASNGNVTTGNIVIQDGNRGISIYGLTGSYNLGDSLTIDVAGDSLISYRGSLEVKINGGGSTVNKAASNVPVIAHAATVAQINAAYSNYECTLVKILNGTVAAGGSYSGSKTLNDGTGNITLYTATGAAFTGQTVPSGSHSWQGIVSQYNTTKQLQLRNPAIDVQ